MTSGERERIRRLIDKAARARIRRAGPTGYHGRPPIVGGHAPDERVRCVARAAMTGERCRFVAKPGEALCGTHLRLLERGDLELKAEAA